MWANVASHLKSGGRFVGVMPNLDPAGPTHGPAAGDEDRDDDRANAEPDEGDVWGDVKHGVASRALRKVEGGWHQRATIDVDPVVEFEDYRLTDEGDGTYTRSARRAGMTGWERRKTLPMKEDVRAREEGFWDDWCKKSSSEICIAYREQSLRIGAWRKFYNASLRLLKRV